MLQPYQERVVQELADLDAKITKLREFFNGETFETLSDIDKTLLVFQYHEMTGYRSALNLRVARFL